ncbi:hypothetical protein [Salinigranum halophilum]|uniref:hypothetical protein n=1 Tax=Salinigranum halophilum TaxID=2565931 RepID=UPI0010A7EAA8|nr:hypothetical protein [Salinigranum halophilum]
MSTSVEIAHGLISLFIAVLVLAVLASVLFGQAALRPVDVLRDVLPSFIVLVVILTVIATLLSKAA